MLKHEAREFAYPFYDSREKTISAARASRDGESAGPVANLRRSIILAIIPRQVI
jgi:hypothetical protein